MAYVLLRSRRTDRAKEESGEVFESDRMAAHAAGDSRANASEDGDL